jgi:hypothetical protein
MTNKMTFEEFKKDWYSKLPKHTPRELELPEHVKNDLHEYFCECDYKRYTGEWSREEL